MPMLPKAVLPVVIVVFTSVISGCAAGKVDKSMSAATVASPQSDDLGQVTALMGEIEALRDNLPDQFEGGADDPFSGPQEDVESKRTQAADEVKRHCEEVASAICVSSEKICQISSRFVGNEELQTHCSLATRECQNANMICRAY